MAAFGRPEHHRHYHSHRHRHRHPHSQPHCHLHRHRHRHLQCHVILLTGGPTCVDIEETVVIFGHLLLHRGCR